MRRQRVRQVALQVGGRLTIGLCLAALLLGSAPAAAQQPLPGNLGIAPPPSGWQGSPAGLWVLSPDEADRQEDLADAHSVLQKTTLGAMAVSGVLGALAAYNMGTLLTEGRCHGVADGHHGIGGGLGGAGAAQGHAAGAGQQGSQPLFGAWGCRGLSTVHGISGVLTFALFTATEVLAAAMPVSPYESTDGTKERAMRTLRWVNIGLIALQPLGGIIGAFPQTLGIAPENRHYVARLLRTIHITTGLTLAGTYTATAVLQW